MQSAFRGMAAGALISAFLFPPMVFSFAQSDKASTSSRLGIIFFGLCLLVWPVYSGVVFHRYRKIAYAKYERSMLAPGGGQAIRQASRMRWVFVWFAATSWAALGIPAAAHTSFAQKVGAGSFAIFLISVLLAVILSAFLELKSTPAEAHRLEEVSRSSEEIRALEA